MQALLELGQSVWLDDFRRGMLRSGELQALIDDGLRGMTSNPTIFEHAIGGSTDYDEGLRALAASPKSDLEIFEQLAVEDVRQAADLFRPVYDATAGADGFVSLEVSPTLARDTERTIAEARRLWARGEPAEPDDQGARARRRAGRRSSACSPTASTSTSPCSFPSSTTARWPRPIMRALEARVRAGQPIDRLASVASFFVSRVDTETDRRIEAKGGGAARSPGQGRGGQRAARLRLVSRSAAARRLAAAGLAGRRPQRLLWASTGTKNPRYSDVLYVDSLIGPDTINTMPPATLQLFEDHGTVRATLPADASEADRSWIGWPRAAWISPT